MAGSTISECLVPVGDLAFAPEASFADNFPDENKDKTIRCERILICGEFPNLL